MDVTVQTKSLRRSAEHLKGIAMRLDMTAKKIQAVAGQLDASMASYEAVIEKLNTYSINLDTLADKTRKAGEAGVKIAYLYEDADNDLVNEESTGRKVAWSIVTGFLGPIGDIADITKNVSRGEYGKVMSTIISTVGDVVENTHGGKVQWKELFNLNKVKDAQGYALKQARSKLTSKVAWAAAIVENGYDNFKEHGGFTMRFLEETGVESAIDIGEVALVGIGVGAAIATAGITAPAWVIGGVTAGTVILVDAGLDKIVSVVTKNPDASWKEMVSDFVCDTGEEWVKVKKRMHESAGKVITNIKEKSGEYVEKTWNNIVNAFRNNGSHCRWGNVNFGLSGR